MSTNPDIVWHRVEDGLPELPEAYSIIECLAFVPGGEYGGMVVPCDFFSDYGMSPDFYRVEQSENGTRDSHERVANVTHWAKVEWPRE